MLNKTESKPLVKIEKMKRKSNSNTKKSNTTPKLAYIELVKRKTTKKLYLKNKEKQRYKKCEVASF